MESTRGGHETRTRVSANPTPKAEKAPRAFGCGNLPAHRASSPMADRAEFQ